MSNTDDYKKMYEFLTGTNKPFNVSQIRKLIQQYDKEEISLSKFTESLNETIYHWQDLPSPAHTEVTDTSEFLKYCKEARDEFCLIFKSLERSNVLSTAVDDLLICFDQMNERLKNIPQVTDTRVWVEKSVSDGLPPVGDKRLFTITAEGALSTDHPHYIISHPKKFKSYLLPVQSHTDTPKGYTTPHTGEPQYKGWNFIDEKWEDVTKEVYDTLLDPARCIVPAGEGRSKDNDTEEFMDYLLEARNAFTMNFWELNPNTEQKVIAENLLIAFDQVSERYSKAQSNPLRDDGWVQPADDKYTEHFIEWRDRFFDYSPVLLEYQSKNSRSRFTKNDLERKYKKAMKESPTK